jgi:hypothetical protein
MYLRTVLRSTDPVTPFEVRFETPPGEQAQVDLARSASAHLDASQPQFLLDSHGAVAGIQSVGEGRQGSINVDTCMSAS